MLVLTPYRGAFFIGMTAPRLPHSPQSSSQTKGPACITQNLFSSSKAKLLLHHCTGAVNQQEQWEEAQSHRPAPSSVKNMKPKNNESDTSVKKYFPPPVIYCVYLLALALSVIFLLSDFWHFRLKAKINPGGRHLVPLGGHPTWP